MFSRSQVLINLCSLAIALNVFAGANDQYWGQTQKINLDRNSLDVVSTLLPNELRRDEVSIENIFVTAKSNRGATLQLVVDGVVASQVGVGSEIDSVKFYVGQILNRQISRLELRSDGQVVIQALGISGSSFSQSVFSVTHRSQEAADNLALRACQIEARGELVKLGSASVGFGKGKNGIAQNYACNGGNRGVVPLVVTQRESSLSDQVAAKICAKAGGQLSILQREAVDFGKQTGSATVSVCRISGKVSVVPLTVTAGNDSEGMDLIRQNCAQLSGAFELVGADKVDFGSNGGTLAYGLCRVR